MYVAARSRNATPKGLNINISFTQTTIIFLCVACAFPLSIGILKYARPRFDPLMLSIRFDWLTAASPWKAQLLRVRPFQSAWCFPFSDG